LLTSLEGVDLSQCGIFRRYNSLVTESLKLKIGLEFSAFRLPPVTNPKSGTINCRTWRRQPGWSM